AEVERGEGEPRWCNRVRVPGVVDGELGEHAVVAVPERGVPGEGVGVGRLDGHVDQVRRAGLGTGQLEEVELVDVVEGADDGDVPAGQGSVVAAGDMEREVLGEVVDGVVRVRPGGVEIGCVEHVCVDDGPAGLEVEERVVHRHPADGGQSPVLKGAGDGDRSVIDVEPAEGQGVTPDVRGSQAHL